jgi:hypothetical protein
MAQMAAQPEQASDPQAYEPCGKLLYFYASLYHMAQERPLYVRVPESIILGFTLPGSVYMHNHPDGSIAFEANCQPE